MPLAAASAAPAIPATPAAHVAPAAPRRPDIEAQVEELNLYSESDDAVGNGDIWHVPESAEMFGKDGFTFRDLLDIINPLQHIPVVSTIYRAISDDTLDPGARLLGGALFGGVGGLAAAIVNAVVAEETGDDIGGNIMTALTGDQSDPPTAPASAPAAAKIAAAETVPRNTPSPLPGALAGPASANPSAVGPHLAHSPAPAQAPVSLLPRSALDAQVPAGTVSKVAVAAPPDAVPRLMLDALDKYEVLSRARRGQALAEEI